MGNKIVKEFFGHSLASVRYRAKSYASSKNLEIVEVVNMVIGLQCCAKVTFKRIN